jgi:hypothetical protein
MRLLINRNNMETENTTEYLYPSANQFFEYFKGNYPGQNQEKMLLLNYFSPGHTITSIVLAEAMGWKNFNSANLHYGGFAGKTAVDMGFRLPDENNKVSFFVDFNMPEAGKDDGHWQWILRPELVEAVHLLDWDNDLVKRNIERDLSNAELMLM